MQRALVQLTAVATGTGSGCIDSTVDFVQNSTTVRFY